MIGQTNGCAATGQMAIGEIRSTGIDRGFWTVDQTGSVHIAETRVEPLSDFSLQSYRKTHLAIPAQAANRPVGLELGSVAKSCGVLIVGKTRVKRDQGAGVGRISSSKRRDHRQDETGFVDRRESTFVLRMIPKRLMPDGATK